MRAGAALRVVAAAALLALTSMPPALAGERTAPAGGSALEEVFPDGLPFPFERVLERLRAVAGPDAVRTALIPLGRSLQRYAAAPDYFGSPRIVVALTGDRARGPDIPMLADRLYIGYAPAAGVVEAIGYDETAGRFEFREIVGYGLDETWLTEAADRAICLRCHQGEGPIFARPLWSESNANPAVAARLGGLGSSFHGVPVRQSVDELDAFDAATDRAARIAIANRLWAEGCPDAPCRARLLADALRFGLNGFRADWRSEESAEAASFGANAARLWRDGLSVVSPDLSNRDPVASLDGADPDSLLETSGALNPETPRERDVLWRPGDGSFDAAVRELAAMLTPGDLAWLDEVLRGRPMRGRWISLDCVIRAGQAGAVPETRFACGNGPDRVDGFFGPDGSGRIDRLTIAGASAPGRIAVRVLGDGRIETAGAAPRLPDGSRIGPFELSGATLRLQLVDDLAPLAEALRQRAEQGDPALGPGPFRRRALLALAANLVGGENG